MRSRRRVGVAVVKEGWGEGEGGEGCRRSDKLGFWGELDAAVCGCGSIPGVFLRNGRLCFRCWFLEYDPCCLQDLTGKHRVVSVLSFLLPPVCHPVHASKVCHTGRLQPPIEKFYPPGDMPPQE